LFISPRRGRADPGGSAIPGRPVVGEEQAPANPPGSKNQLISMLSIESVPEIKPIRTDTTL